jgi:hypothetical protein
MMASNCAPNWQQGYSNSLVIYNQSRSSLSYLHKAQLHQHIRHFHSHRTYSYVTSGDRHQARMTNVTRSLL